MGHPLDGILLIDKRVGETSHEVVRRVKAAFRAQGLKKVGHAGTLDAPAEGLLIVLLGQGTKLFPYLASGTKRYRATMTLGVETDTMDTTGTVLRTRDVPPLSGEAIRTASGKFVGEIEQIPPAFSAVKVDGIRAYRLARKGLAPELKKRKVKIHELSVLSVALPDVTLDVICSGGTYIRALVSDMGREIGPGASLKSLRRLEIGAFRVEDGLASLRVSDRTAALEDRVIPLRASLPHMAEIFVGEELAALIRNGRQPAWEECRLRESAGGRMPRHAKVVDEHGLVAIARVDWIEEVDHGRVRIERVFS